MLALKGQLDEAEKHSAVAVKQSGVAFADAAHNLKLCRSLLKGSARDSVATLKAEATTQGARIPEYDRRV